VLQSPSCRGSSGRILLPCEGALKQARAQEPAYKRKLGHGALRSREASEAEYRVELNLIPRRS